MHEAQNVFAFVEARLLLHGMGFVLDQRGPHYILRQDCPERPGEEDMPRPMWHPQRAEKIRAHTLEQATVMAARIIMSEVMES